MRKKILAGSILLAIILVAAVLLMTREKDSTAPEVEGVEKDLDNESVTPTFTEGRAELNGEAFSSGTAVSADGSYTLEVTDDNGNTAVNEFTIDQTAPEKPAVDGVDEGTETIEGSAEANSRVKVWSDEELLAVGMSGDDGTFSLPVALPPGGSTVFIAAIDPAGNQSEMAEVEVRDVTAPDAPEVAALTEESTAVLGKSEAGAAVRVFADNKKIGETTVNDKGVFEVEIARQASGTELTVSAIDASGNKSEAQTVKVGSSQGQDIEPTYLDGILVVNKKYGLPPSYAPGIDPTAQSALNRMLADAGKAGHDLSVISSYRSYSYQEELYNRYVSSHGEEQAKRFAALPGHSEHQTGLTFDLGGTENDGDWLSGSFGDTPAGEWLAANAHEYGFIVRYPKGKEAITGYIYEPWHFRYLGVENATDVYNSGLTLEEYLGISGR